MSKTNASSPIRSVVKAPPGHLLRLQQQSNRLTRFFEKRVMTPFEVRRKAELKKWLLLGIQQAKGYEIRRPSKLKGPFSESLVISKALESAGGVDELIASHEERIAAFPEGLAALLACSSEVAGPATTTTSTPISPTAPPPEHP